jgi:hypothetical protein
MKRFLLVLSYSFAMLFAHKAGAQSTSSDSVRLNYSQIYSFCLNGDVKSALSLIEVAKKKESFDDTQFKIEFEDRFK